MSTTLNYSVGSAVGKGDRDGSDVIGASSVTVMPAESRALDLSTTKAKVYKSRFPLSTVTSLAYTDYSTRSTFPHLECLLLGIWQSLSMLHRSRRSSLVSRGAGSHRTRAIAIRNLSAPRPRGSAGLVKLGLENGLQIPPPPSMKKKIEGEKRTERKAMLIEKT